jgi:hypothetical protein
VAEFVEEGLVLLGDGASDLMSCGARARSACRPRVTAELCSVFADVDGYSAFVVVFEHGDEFESGTHCFEVVAQR